MLGPSRYEATDRHVSGLQIHRLSEEFSAEPMSFLLAAGAQFLGVLLWLFICYLFLCFLFPKIRVSGMSMDGGRGVTSGQMMLAMLAMALGTGQLAHIFMFCGAQLTYITHSILGSDLHFAAGEFYYYYLTIFGVLGGLIEAFA